MTAHEFLQSKEPNVFIVPEEWLEEYVNIVSSIAAEKVKVEDIYPKYVENIYGELEHYKVNVDSILNCLKE